MNTIKIVQGPDQYGLSYALFSGWETTVVTEHGKLKVTVDTLHHFMKDEVDFFGKCGDRAYEATININPHSPDKGVGKLTWV